MSRKARRPSEYVSAAEIKKVVSVHNDTLKNWASKNIIRYIQVGGHGGHRYYHRSDVLRYCGLNSVAHGCRETILYARVSSSHQKPDLARQVEALQHAFPEASVIQDVGSGINFRRRGLLTLLERVHRGLVETVVVAHKDRLCRFGHELLAFIFEKADCKLVVLDEPNDGTTGSTDRELSDDLLSIVNVFVARRNGKRSASHRRDRIKRQGGEAKKRRTKVEEEITSET